MRRVWLTLGLLGLGILAGCSPGGPTPLPTAAATATAQPATPTPQPSGRQISPTALTVPPTVLTPLAAQPSPTRTPRPTQPTPTAVPIPTWPVVIPSTATPSPTPVPPVHLTAADLLPPGAVLMADAVADVGPNGAPAAVLVYHQVVAHTLHPDSSESDVFLDGAGLHLWVRPLNGATYVPQGTAAESPVTLAALDLNGDGLREALTVPRWQGGRLFVRGGLASWPAILAAGKIDFEGGYLEDQYMNAGVYAQIYGYVYQPDPTLYYAGPKAATVADVDGDGLYEVDIAYSLEDGADIWRVERYRWDGQVYDYTETYSRTAAEAVPPERYRAMAAAVEALYDPRDLTEDGEPPPGVQVLAQAVYEVDADGDGQPETLLAYHIRPVYEDRWEHYLHGYTGLALFDAAGRLVWSGEIEELPEGIAFVDVALFPVDLAANEPGLLYQRLHLYSGSGQYRDSRATLYRWDGLALVSIWDGPMMAGGQSGTSDGYHDSSAVRLADLDGDGWNELLLEWTRHSYVMMEIYTLFSPGELAWRWDGESYVPYALRQGDELLPVRPRLPVFYAPRVSRPLVVDGGGSDLSEVEYWDNTNWYGWLGGPWHFYPQRYFYPSFAWDEQLLYLKVAVLPTQTVVLALDGDLTGDWGTAALDGDDVVLEISAISETAGCEGPWAIRVLHPEGRSLDAQAAAQRWPRRSRCTLEFGIPLAELGLDGAALVPQPGWCVGGLGAYGPREYHPTAGRTLGLAIGLDPFLPAAAFSPTDPTTWTTLVLMADR